MLGHLWEQSKCLSCLFDVTQTLGTCRDGILSFCLKFVSIFWCFGSVFCFCFNLEDNTYEILTGIEGEPHPPSPSFAPASKSSPQRSRCWVSSKFFPCVVIHVYLFFYTSRFILHVRSLVCSLNLFQKTRQKRMDSAPILARVLPLLHIPFRFAYKVLIFYVVATTLYNSRLIGICIRFSLIFTKGDEMVICSISSPLMLIQILRAGKE